MSIPEGQRAYLMLDQPSQYLTEVLPQILSTTPRLSDIPDQSRTDEILVGLQSQRWETQTGISCENSKFTVILPIYNEEHALPSTLAALMISDIPKTVHAQFLFIVNGSTDRSAEIVHQHLATLGAVDEIPMTSMVDPHINSVAYRTHRGNVSFTLIETPTYTKANALNIGNEMAINAGHTIALCIDADRYVEPSTIPLLFSYANRVFQDPDKHAVVVDGRLILESKPSLFQQLFRKDMNILEASDSAINVYGSLHAWDTAFLQEIGGMKKILIEDFALALDAYLRGFQAQHSAAQVWGYEPNTPIDFLRERVRYNRGFMQLQAIFKDNPLAIKTMQEYSRINYPLPVRLKKYTQQLWHIKSKPSVFLNQIAKIAFQEFGRILAVYKHWQNPHAETWAQIKSSK